jgi:hypothetical protein
MAFRADVEWPATRPLPNAEKRDNTEILLRDPEESSVNRGYHLEYYGDIPFESASTFSCCCGIGNVVDAPSLTDQRCAAALT